MEALVGAFNQEKALVGAFSVLVQPVVEPMDRFAAIISSYVMSGPAVVSNSNSIMISLVSGNSYLHMDCRRIVITASLRVI